MTRTTKYMLTIDGRPAVIQWYRGGPSARYAGGRNKARLFDSLKELRDAQRDCVSHTRWISGDRPAAIEAGSYGYVLVEVPQP